MVRAFSAPSSTRRPAIMIGAMGFVVSGCAAGTLHASLLTWMAGFITLWTVTASVMAYLWPAPVPTRAQVATTRGEERVAWPPIRARLLPVFSPWFVGLGGFVGLAASQRGWGTGNLWSADRSGEGNICFDLAAAMVLTPLAVLLATSVTLPALYAAHHSGAERHWGLARAHGFAGAIGLLTCCVMIPDDGDNVSGGHVNPIRAVRFVGHLVVGDSESRPGWLVPVAYLSLLLIGAGLWFLIRSERAGQTPGDERH